MKQLILILSLALAACGPLGSSSNAVLPVSPAPLARTAIDDEQLRNAWMAYEAAIDAVNLIPTSVLKPGSPKALAIANANDRVLAAFQLVENIDAGLSTQDPLKALADLKAALVNFRVAIGSK